jgi:hypothetical protein
MEETMAEENMGLDLASQTGQENIVEAITALTTALSNVTGIQGPKGEKGDPGVLQPPATDGTYILSLESGVVSWVAVTDGDGGSY